MGYFIYGIRRGYTTGRKREGNRIVQTEINEKNIQWVFSEITATSFRWQRMVKCPDDTWETEAELLQFVDD